ncbi:MAG: lysozyme family protein [Enterococcus sp.]
MKKEQKKFRWVRRILLCILTIGVVGVAILLGRTYSQAKKVDSYQSEITTALKKYDMEKYESLVKGIILTESKGVGTDLMQSSESLHGEQNKIKTTAKSIDQGVYYLSTMIKKAKENDCDLWTAVQAYNYGEDYISYVKKHGEKTTIELAEAYSKDVLGPILGNDDETTYRYYRIEALLYNGGYLYHNGGNMFYADIVEFNTKIMSTFDSIFS